MELMSYSLHIYNKGARNFFIPNIILVFFLELGEAYISYREIHEKSSGVVSAVCFTIYTLSIYPSAYKQLRRHLPNPFRVFSCITKDDEDLNNLFKYILIY